MTLNRTHFATAIAGLMGISTLAILTMPAGAQVNRLAEQDDRSVSMELAQTAPTDEAAATSTLASEFILMAAQGNNAEIQTSQLALERSQDEAVQQYAQRMIDEHTAANQQLEPIAAEYGVTLPTTPSSFDTAVLEALAQVPGEQFDQAYMDAQVNLHLKSLGVFRTGALQVEDAALQQYAASLLPSIQEHLEMANEMSRNSASPEPQ